MPNFWATLPALPAGPAAALAALHLSEPRLDLLGRLGQREWAATLDYCDRARLTPVLRDRAREAMPAAVQERVDTNAAKNAIRVRGIAELYRDLHTRLDAAGLEFIALKGLTHAALFRSGWEQCRMQYDVDLYLPREAAVRAQEAMVAAGWETLPGMEAFPTDHLPALIRRTGWAWRGDFFDTEIPLSVELHVQFWNTRIEQLPAPGVEEFWTRRIKRPIGGIEMGMLSRPDALGYAALHALKHVLRGSAKPFHIFEIATILDGLANDDRFWREWHGLHSPELRRLEAVMFRMAAEWFGGRTAEAVREEIHRLPAAAAAWFADFAGSPATQEFRPNKDELWLHLSLLPPGTDRWSVARRRLFPGNLPPVAVNAFIAKPSWRQRATRWARRLAYIGKRARHHALALPQTAFSGLRWWRRTRAGLLPRAQSRPSDPHGNVRD